MDIVAVLYEIARHNGGLITRAQAAEVGVTDQRLAEGGSGVQSLESRMGFMRSVLTPSRRLPTPL
jgi:hypothetical protein